MLLLQKTHNCVVCLWTLFSKWSCQVRGESDSVLDYIQMNHVTPYPLRKTSGFRAWIVCVSWDVSLKVTLYPNLSVGCSVLSSCI